MTDVIRAKTNPYEFYARFQALLRQQLLEITKLNGDVPVQAELSLQERESIGRTHLLLQEAIDKYFILNDILEQYVSSIIEGLQTAEITKVFQHNTKRAGIAVLARSPAIQALAIECKRPALVEPPNSIDGVTDDKTKLILAPT